MIRDVPRSALFLGEIHDKTAARATAERQAIIATSIALFTLAAIVMAVIVSDWSAIADRLADAIDPPRV